MNRPTTKHGFLSYPGVLDAFGHGGDLSYGFSLDFAIVPEMRFGYVLLTNVAGELHLRPTVQELLLGSPEPPMAGSNLPDAQAVEGRFITARRMEGDFLEFMSYAGLTGNTMAQVSALDENTIQFSFGAIGSAVYIQTAPYVFQVYAGADATMLSRFIPELRFLMENGTPVQIITANGMDFTAMPTGRTMPFLIASIVSVVLSVVFFLVAPIVLFVMFLIRRKKQPLRTRFDRFSTGFLLSGTLLTLSNLVLFGLFGINPFRTIAEVSPFIWINYVLSGLTALLFAGSIFSWRTLGEARTKRKALFMVTSVIAAKLIVLLWHWNFFVIL